MRRDRLDARYGELDPIADPRPAAIAAGRSSMASALAVLGRIPDASLEAPWPWDRGGETDVRTAFYLSVQALQDAAGRARAARIDLGVPGGPAHGALAAATAARWDLKGLLAGLTDKDLDADPGDGEWTVRQTLAHALHVQRAYPWFSAWWLARRDDPVFPASADATHGDGLPPEDADGAGSPERLAARIDALVDLGIDLWLDATDDELTVRARWSGAPVDVGFRLGRWAPHLAEHTVQVEKTLLMVGRPTREVERLVRLLHRAWGEVEGAVIGLTADALDGGALSGRVAGALVDAAEEVARLGQGASDAAMVRTG